MSSTRAPSGHFKVLYFATASAFAAKNHEFIPAPLPLGQLFDALEERHAGIRISILESSMVTLNLEYVDVPSGGKKSNVVIREGDEVGIIPPVSSG